MLTKLAVLCYLAGSILFVVGSVLMLWDEWRKPNGVRVHYRNVGEFPVMPYPVDDV